MKSIEDKISKFVSKNLEGLKPKGEIHCSFNNSTPVSCKSTYSSGLLSRTEQAFFENLSEENKLTFLNLLEKLKKKSHDADIGIINSCSILFNSNKFDFKYY